MRIVIDRDIPGLEAALLERGHEVLALEGKAISRESLEGAEALLVRTRTRCDASLLEGSSIRLVGSATIGTDHIDKEWCDANGIRVVNAPGCNATGVMQYVACTLARAGFEPSRHVLGVIGKGHIGSLVVDLYRRAGGKVLVSDPPRRDAGLSDEDYLSIEDVIKASDAITLHVPYTRPGESPYPTLHLLSEELLGSGSKIIVNASRGLVMEPSVFESDHRLIIDTWPFEDAPELWSPANRKRIINKAFIATPHIAGYTVEGKRRATMAMLEAIDAFSGLSVAVKEEGRGASPMAAYTLPEVIDSFDPVPVSDALKADPSGFELFRSRHLRPLRFPA